MAISTARLGSSQHPLEMKINKRFFVSMLTRDIELEDAILDLLDNSLDGVIRSTTKSLDTKNPYRGYWAKINLDSQNFEILDNCGGIPKELIESAFGIGKAFEPSTPNRTIGIYGIGMKRAIFKMALEAKVQSHSTFGFEVAISESWMGSQNEWELPYRKVSTSFRLGTRVFISKLRPEIAQIFRQSYFVTSLYDFVSRQYAAIIEKGFRVYINGILVDAAPIALLSVDADSIKTGRPAFAPYMMRFETKKVRASIWVGMYRAPLETEAEDEAEREQRQSRDTSGWTVICNDRAIVSNDTTILTGWGEAGVPRFHSQFIGIRGIVSLESEYPMELPLTTTKRGLDAASELFLQLKDYMREGTKVFTSFTNQWKADRAQARRILERADLLDLPELRRLMKVVPFMELRKLQGAERFQPHLPMPAPSSMKRISFLRHQDQVSMLARSLLDDDRAKPSDVGAYCFDEAVRRVSRK